MGSVEPTLAGEVIVTLESNGDLAKLSSKESVRLASDDGGYLENEGICMSSWLSSKTCLLSVPLKSTSFTCS